MFLTHVKEVLKAKYNYHKLFRFYSKFTESNKSKFKADKYKLLKGKAVVNNNVLILYLNIIPDQT